MNQKITIYVGSMYETLNEAFLKNKNAKSFSHFLRYLMQIGLTYDELNKSEFVLGLIGVIIDISNNGLLLELNNKINQHVYVDTSQLRNNPIALNIGDSICVNGELTNVATTPITVTAESLLQL